MGDEPASPEPPPDGAVSQPMKSEGLSSRSQGPKGGAGTSGTQPASGVWPLLAVGAATGVAGALAGGLALFSGWTARRVERQNPPRGRFLRVRDADLHYVDAGSGPPVVIIHGLDGQVGDFTYSLVERLADDHRVIVLERPGSGHSTQPTDALASIREQARTVAAFIGALGLEAPLVMGHSFGGAVALALALDHPEAVGALALVAPLTCPEIRIPKIFKPLAIRSRALRKLFAHTLAVPLSMVCSETMLDEIFGPEHAPMDYAVKAGQDLSLRPKSFYTSSTDLTAANDDLPRMVARYKQLKLPVGVLYGSEDRVLDHRVHGLALTDLIEHLELDLVPGGHMLPVTQPDTTAAFVRRMASRIGASSAMAPAQRLLAA
jgi:pimeloyl-ACP methyl ester carboxylesterase